jgi:hypothetical protein
MFGFVIFAVAVIWTLSARKRVGTVLAWAAGGSVLAGLLGAVGVLPFMGAATAAGIGAAFGSVIGASKAFRHVRPQARPSAFEATHGHDNLAINTHRAKIWTRDERGRETVLEAHEVREWTHLWIPDRGYKADNRIQLTTTRVDQPVIVVAFNRHSATVWGAPKNAAECEEWHARLGAFFNR